MLLLLEDVLKNEREPDDALRRKSAPSAIEEADEASCASLRALRGSSDFAFQAA
jgi:hypothetical protein